MTSNDGVSTRRSDVTAESGIAFESGMRGIDGFPFVDPMARTSAADDDYDSDVHAQEPSDAQSTGRHRVAYTLTILSCICTLRV